MKITGTQKVEVDVSPEMLKHIVLNYLYENFSWKPEYFIDDGDVCEMAVYTTSHTWKNKETIRKATAADKTVSAMVKEIQKI